MLGFEPIGSYPIGSSGDQVLATFDLRESDDSESIVKVASLFDRVAELFAGFGYEVELTQRTRDGGKDIIAIKRGELN